MCSGSHRFTLRDLNATTFNFPPLHTWAEQQLSAVVTAHSQVNFSTAFDDFISKDVSVTFNGVALSRVEYEQKLQGEITSEGAAIIDILDFVQAAEPSNNLTQVGVCPDRIEHDSKQHPQNSGAIGLFFDVTFAHSDSKRKSQSSLNIL